MAKKLLADQTITKGQTRFWLESEFTDSFTDLQKTGEMEFRFNKGHLPFLCVDPKVTGMMALFKLEDGSKLENLLIEIAALDDNIFTILQTNANGLVFTMELEAGPMNLFIGRPLLQRWKIKIPHAGNETLFENGFAWHQISDIVLAIDYEAEC